MSIIACCGLDCSQCPAHLAWKNDDQALRQKTALEWSQMYKAEITPEQINCTGCHSPSEPLFGHCHQCDIRACAQERGHATCAPCPDYACSRLDFVHQAVPQARQNLDDLRSQG